MMLIINNSSSEKTKQRLHVLTCSHWSSPHKMSHLAMCIFHIHETCYWQILPMRNNKAFSWPSMLQLLSNILFSFISRSSDVSFSGPLIVRKRFYLKRWVFVCEEYKLCNQNTGKWFLPHIMPRKEVLVFLRIKALKVSLKLKGRGGGVLSVIYINYYCMTHLGHSFYL